MWTHKVFWCQDEGCVEGRKVFHEKLEAAAALVKGGGSVEANQICEMLWALEQNMFSADSARASATRRHAQRFLGGYTGGGGGRSARGN